MKAVNLCASAILGRECYMKSVKVLSAMPFTEGEFQKKRVAAYCLSRIAQNRNARVRYSIRSTAS